MTGEQRVITLSYFYFNYFCFYAHHAHAPRRCTRYRYMKNPKKKQELCVCDHMIYMMFLLISIVQVGKIKKKNSPGDHFVSSFFVSKCD